MVRRINKELRKVLFLKLSWNQTFELIMYKILAVYDLLLLCVGCCLDCVFINLVKKFLFSFILILKFYTVCYDLFLSFRIANEQYWCLENIVTKDKIKKNINPFLVIESKTPVWQPEILTILYQWASPFMWL